jgi:hypothetical protein
VAKAAVKPRPNLTLKGGEGRLWHAILLLLPSRRDPGVLRERAQDRLRRIAIVTVEAEKPELRPHELIED